MKKLVLFLLVLGIGGVLYLGYKQMASEPMESGMPSPTGASTRMMTMDEVAKHGSKEDCWLLIEGKVYDVTAYVGSGFHPGKEAILMGCGKDATEIFNNRPNGSGSHSAKARGFLQKYYIGELEK